MNPDVVEPMYVTIAIARDCIGFEANKTAAHTGGRIAGNARKSIQKEIGRPVVSRHGYLPNRSRQDQLIDEGGKRLTEKGQ